MKAWYFQPFHSFKENYNSIFSGLEMCHIKNLLAEYQEGIELHDEIIF